MISKRIIASIIVKDGLHVQSRGFSQYLPVGSPDIAVEFLNAWGADEILMLDIGDNRVNRTPDFSLISRVSQKGFVPLTVGGGIDTIESMRRVIHEGADKFAINRAAVENPTIITEAARIFGEQCVVVSIDARKKDDGSYEVFIDNGRIATGTDPVQLARESEKAGAGEILIRAIERDGQKSGFDTHLVRMIADAVRIPVVAAGGCGHPQHMLDALVDGKADAVAVGNFFQFTEHSVTTAKAYLAPHISVRLDSYATYERAAFDEDGRLKKTSDAALEKLRFEYHPKETI